MDAIMIRGACGCAGQRYQMVGNPHRAAGPRRGCTISRGKPIFHIRGSIFIGDPTDQDLRGGSGDENIGNHRRSFIAVGRHKGFIRADPIVFRRILRMNPIMKDRAVIQVREQHAVTGNPRCDILLGGGGSISIGQAVFDPRGSGFIGRPGDLRLVFARHSRNIRNRRWGNIAAGGFKGRVRAPAFVQRRIFREYPVVVRGAYGKTVDCQPSDR